MNGKVRLALLLIALYVAAFAVRLYATADRVSAGHGDVAGYYHVAKNLAEGRGFVQDFVAEYLEDPRSIPTASNTWWLPLPSIIAATGMWLQGDTSYVAAKRTMIAVSSLIPILCFFCGWFLLGSRLLGIATGILAVGFHLYLDQPNATLSHGPYGLFAAAGLVIVMAWREHPRLLPWFGLCFGMTYLCRGDSQVLALGLAATWGYEWWRRRRERGSAAEVTIPQKPMPWRSLLIAMAVFVAIVGPWWARNLSVLGTPMPSGMSKITWGRNFEEWFVSNPSNLTFERYLDWGLENIYEQKRSGVVDALTYTPFVFYRAVLREQETEAGDVAHELGLFGKWVLTPLLFLGLAYLWVRRRASFFSLILHLSALVVIYGVVFPAVGRESYRSALFSVFPVFLTAVIGGLAVLATPLRRFSERVFHGVVLVVAIALSVVNVVVAMPHLRQKCSSVEATLAPYRAFGRWAKARGLANETFLVRNPWQFTVETGMKCAVIPNDGVVGVLERVKLYGAKYLVDESSGGISILEKRPALKALVARGNLVPAYPNDPPPRFRLYLFRGDLSVPPR